MGEYGQKRRLLTRREAAAYITENHFKISARTLAIYASDEIGPPYRILGGAAHYSQAEIDAWVKSPAHDGIVAPPRPGALSKP